MPLRFELLTADNGKPYVNQCKGNRILNSSETFETKQAAMKNITSVAKDLDPSKKFMVKDFTNEHYPFIWWYIQHGKQITDQKFARTGKPKPTGKQ
jgi:uncharacterized protein YegP (UPF0339 family)